MKVESFSKTNKAVRKIDTTVIGKFIYISFILNIHRLDEAAY